MQCSLLSVLPDSGEPIWLGPQDLPIAPRHSRRSGNPETRSCAKTAMPTNTRRVGRSTSHLDHLCRATSGWMGNGLWIPAAARMTGVRGQWTTDSRCGENDGSKGGMDH